MWTGRPYASRTPKNIGEYFCTDCLIICLTFYEVERENGFRYATLYTIIQAGFKQEQGVRTMGSTGPDSSTEGKKGGTLSATIGTGIAVVHCFGELDIFTVPC